ncbi:hypothetical protein C8J57DRAFT_1311321 [Mycena rebaudengoi]|nr:hypothetical protein C8J57DRAFT_1311321 [Mycena rebaudengoi]
MMTPTLAIHIPSRASSPASESSAASSPTGSDSSTGVYIPVHRRVNSASSSSSSRGSSPEPHRTLPIYTPSELMQLAQSPLSRRLSSSMHDSTFRSGGFSEIAVSKRRQRSREYLQRNNSNTLPAATTTTAHITTTPTPAPAQRRSKPQQRNASKINILDDGASWRPMRRVAVPVV